MPQVDAQFVADSVRLAEAVVEHSKLIDRVKEAAPAAIDALIKHNFVLPEKRAEFIERLESDPSIAITTIKKMAFNIGPRSIGGSENKDKVPDDGKQPSDRFWEETYGRSN